VNIYLCAGTYPEQVKATHSLTLIGTGEASTTIQAPTGGLDPTPGGSDYSAVVYGINGANLSLQTLTVDGNAQGDVNNPFAGVQFVGASGSLNTVAVTKVRGSYGAAGPTGITVPGSLPSQLTSSGTGVGVVAENDTAASTDSVSVTNATVTDFQSAG